MYTKEELEKQVAQAQKDVENMKKHIWMTELMAETLQRKIEEME